jgi:hypothetical protein
MYIGNCTHIGCNTKYPISKFFSDATEMAYFVGNPDEGTTGRSKQIDFDLFLNFINKDDIPKSALKGDNLSFYYVAEDDKGEIKLNEAAIFFIYNQDKDIHYFFRK